LEVSAVRRRIQQAIEASKERARDRREHVAAASQAYDRFLADVATPLMRQVANALKVDGNLAFTVGTPTGGVRLTFDKQRDDYIELALDTASDRPQVIGHVRYTRGSRTIDDERPVKAGVPPEALTDEDLLDFLMGALEPWLER
jgi:hypothetical protein